MILVVIIVALAGGAVAAPADCDLARKLHVEAACAYPHVTCDAQGNVRARTVDIPSGAQWDAMERAAREKGRAADAADARCKGRAQ